MTGFGRGEAALGAGRVSAEVRCVNSRHLEVRVRLPREWGELETGLREVASSAFGRGQVDVSLRVSTDAAASGVDIDLEAARRYLDGAERLRDEIGAEGTLSVATLVTLPGVAVTREPVAPDERDASALRAAVEAACAAAAGMRAREGESLDRELRERLSGFETRVEQVAGHADEIQKGLRERLDKRLAALEGQVEIDPGRLEQEVVMYADRMDVTEEVVRLRSHLAQFRETLLEAGPVGRKLEFLIQEVGREINTIGSKAGQAELTRCVVEMKAELEKLREQVLNVE
jgi:uncharacterized protein (TIGR00255 family)